MRDRPVVPPSRLIVPSALSRRGFIAARTPLAPASSAGSPSCASSGRTTWPVSPHASRPACPTTRVSSRWTSRPATCTVGGDGIVRQRLDDIFGEVEIRTALEDLVA